MNIEIFHVDAFTNTPFKGNTAAVCPLKEWLAPGLLQQIAFQNNLSETAFYLPQSKGFDIRWFSPTTEVELCGHATLATAYIIYEIKKHSPDPLIFSSQSGVLSAFKKDGYYCLDFPSDTIKQIAIPNFTSSIFTQPVKEVWQGKGNFLFIFKHQQQVAALEPKFNNVNVLGKYGCIVSAPGDDCDFVSRYFAPQYGIYEDSVTGSTHATLCQYWQKKLNKKQFFARQISKRSGALYCQLNSRQRIIIRGQARLYLKGCIEI